MLGTEGGRETKVSERVETAVRHQRNTGAAPAIAAIRTAEGYELLAPEAGNAIAAVSGFDPNSGFIDKFHGG